MLHHANQAAIIALFCVFNRYVDNLPPMRGAMKDYAAAPLHTGGVAVHHVGPGRQPESRPRP